MAALANVPIPAHVARTLDTLGADTQAVQNYAVQLSVDMCRHILRNEQAIGIHLFTLNQREMCRSEPVPYCKEVLSISG